MKKIISLLILVSGAAVAAPPPGHPSVEQAADTMALPRNPNLDNLPNTGTVVQTIPSNEYVYVEVEQNGTKRWLAAPRVDLVVGQQVKFSNGTLMRNFYSKKHMRTFDEVLFVSRVAPAVE